MQVIIHPGFHKTGTSTLQAALRTNRRALAPDIEILLDTDMTGLIGATKGYSKSHSLLDLSLVIYETAQIASRLNPTTKTVILSSESLCGHIPGRGKVKDYRSAPALLAAISDAFAEIPAEIRLTFFFTLRNPETWLASCYGQHLRASRMKLDAEEYMDLFRPSAQLEKTVADCAKALPSARIATARLEDTAQTRLGFLDPLLDLADYPASKRTALVPAPRANQAPTPAQMAALLDINRSALSDADARAARLTLNRETA